MTLRNAAIEFLLRRLGHRPAESPTRRRETSTALSAAEQEQVVRAALLPYPHNAIDATFENLYPIEDDGGYTCIVHLDDVVDTHHTVVRKVLSAGSALEMVRPDDVEPRSYQVHSTYYKLLAKIRSDGASPGLAATVILTNGLHSSAEPAKTPAPTETDISRALHDVANEASDFVILARSADPYADYIQVGAGPGPFRVECRVWLNNSVAEHFHVLDLKNGASGDFADINDVTRTMLYWFVSGRLPADVGVRNMTAELADFQKVAQGTPQLI